MPINDTITKKTIKTELLRHYNKLKKKENDYELIFKNIENENKEIISTTFILVNKNNQEATGYALYIKEKEMIRLFNQDFNLIRTFDVKEIEEN